MNRNSILCILGPSGCGKSTLLKIIAGLLAPDRGSICINGSDQRNVPTADRELGFVFQRDSLFPHLTVYENVAFPFRHGRRSLRSSANDDWTRAVERILRLVQMDSFRDRNVATLSGGQAQRVAIARALVYNPSLLLLDEPLSSSDNSLKRQLIDLLLELHVELGNTFVFVTHDEREVARMATDVAVIGQNHTLLQKGQTAALYDAPETSEVALLLEDWNVFTCTFLSVAEGRVNVRAPWGTEMSVQLMADDLPIGPSLLIGLPVSRLRIVSASELKKKGMIRLGLQVHTLRREAHRTMLICSVRDGNGLIVRLHTASDSPQIQGALLTGEIDENEFRLFR